MLTDTILPAFFTAPAAPLLTNVESPVATLLTLVKKVFPANAVYMAGPMTGYPAYNKAQFDYYKARWEDTGCAVVTPHDLNSMVFQAIHGRPFDAEQDVADWGDEIVNTMVMFDMIALALAPKIAVLPGFRSSRGSKAELVTALNLGKPVLDADTMEPLDITADVILSAKDEPIVVEAERLVYGDRQKSYGHPYDDYERTSRMWEGMLGLEPGFIGPEKAALMMAVVKISRECNRPKRDNLVDLAGYAECAHLIAQRTREIAERFKAA